MQRLKDNLEEAYLKFKNNKEFKKELDYYLREYAGRPTPLYFAQNLTEKIGADCVLLIQSIFDKKFASDIDEFISYTHKKNMVVLLEAHTKDEFLRSTQTDADILGINNRNLDTLEIDLNTTKEILKDRNEERIILSESGIGKPEDIRFLHKCGSDAFLVGSSIMKSRDIKGHVEKLVSSI